MNRSNAHPAHLLFVAVLCGIAALLVGTTFLGCTHPREPKVVSNPNPTGKIPADIIAVQNHDKSVIPQLIKDLRSDDAAVRIYAIEALHRLTGQTLGYEPYDTDDQRLAAIERWQQWQRKSDNHTPATTQTSP